MTRARIATFAAVGLAVTLPPVASGGGQEPAPAPPGIVKFSSKPPYFHGKVVAEVPNCQGPRKVRLYEREKDGDRRRLGTTMSGSYVENGKWELLVDPEPGEYFAAAPKFETIDDGAGNDIVCARTKSRTVTLD